MRVTYQCPECESTDLRVHAYCWATLLFDGTIDDTSTPEYDNDSTTTCQVCDHEGRAKDFEHDKEGQTQ